jgi:hypothetical protein
MGVGALEVLSWHAWFGGDLGDDRVDAMLSYQLQISESLAEECEAVDEARPPRSGQDRWFALVSQREFTANSLLKQEGRRSGVCGLRMMGPWWRSSGCRFGLQRVATLGATQCW